MSRRFWDDATYPEDRPSRPHDPELSPACFDCGTDTFVDAETGHVIVYSVPGRVFCAPCYRWRAKRLAEFDSRTKQQIERLDEHVEVFARR